jgi:hypothetical protein
MAKTEAEWGVRIGLISDSWKWDDKPALNNRPSSPVGLRSLFMGLK